MPLDFSREQPSADRDAKRRSGQVGYLKGLSAEDQVIRQYERAGLSLRDQRWRGQCGELDLVFEAGDEIVIVEVKASKTHARAVGHLSQRQCTRICQSAEEYLGTCPRGSLTPMRFDVALVDSRGAIDILENALMAA